MTFRSKPLSKHALGTPHLPLLTLDSRTSHPTRPRQRLEGTLCPMMIITPLYHIHMHRHPGRHGPAAQPMVHHLAAQLPDHGSLEAEIADEEGSRGDVEDGTGEGLVEGRVEEAEASEAGARA